MENFLRSYYSLEELKHLNEIIESPPLCSTIRVNTLKISRDVAKKILQDHFLSCHEMFKVEEHPDFPDVLIVPALGPNFVKPAEKEIIVDCSSGTSLLRGADLYAGGIIGMNENIAKNDLVSVWADVDGNCCKGSKSVYLDKKVFIGNGICQLDRTNVFGDFKVSNIGVKMTEMKFKMPSFNGVFLEELFLQNLPSIAVCQFLNPTAYSRVLDMCASPGGKTCHAAALMNNSGTIYSIDKVSKKTLKIQDNCSRLGVTNVHVLTADSSKLIENGVFEAESFDFVILDPPCSGLGLRPNLKFNFTDLHNLDSFAPYQRKLFSQAWALLKPGGRMSYSTCTLNPFENETLIEKMLCKFENAKLLPIRSGALEKYCLPGLKVGSLSQETCEKCLCRFFPSKLHDTNGFFFAIFEKAQK